MKTPVELEAAVREYQSGNREEFDKVYELSHRYLYVCIEHLVRNEDAAKDLLQETYLDITKNILQLRDPEDFLSWAAAIARRRCYAYFKMADKWILSNEGEDGQELIASVADDEAFIPESILQDMEKRRLIREIIDGLSDMQRLCVIAYYYQERKQEEIAEELGIPINTVKSHLNRAKAKIRQEVLALEKEKDTKLYTLAPFMLLFFAEEAEACEAVPMSEELRDTVRENRVNEEDQGGTSKLGSLAKIGLKGRILIGLAVVLGLAAVIGAVVFRSSEEVQEPAEQAPAQSQEAQAESDEQMTTETGEEAVEAEPEAAEETEEYEELAISGKYDQMGLGRDGIIVVSTGGKWGLVTYDDQVIVPIEYDYACTAPNDDGQTFFGREGDFRVFDREGNEIFRTDKPIKAVSGGVVLWTQTGEDMMYHFGYVNLDGTTLFESDGSDVDGEAGAVGFNESYAFSSSGSRGTEYRISQDGTVDDIFEERGILRHPELLQEQEVSSDIVFNGTSTDINLFYPVGACYKGYYVDRGIDYFEDTNGKFYVYDAQGKEQYCLRMESVAERAGYPYYDESGDLTWSVGRFYQNGNYCFSNQTKMAVSVSYGGETTSYLIDTAKQEKREDGYGGTLEFLTDEAVLAEGDYVGIADTAYWLYQRDGQWGYIDQDGNVAQMFDDAAQFYDGKAMVIKDGNAYFIDENMNPGEWKIPAQSVRGYGEVFAVTTEDGQKCYLADKN